MTSPLRDAVMRRVYAASYMRSFASTGALAAVLVIVSLYAISQEVWVAMIFENMPSLLEIDAVIRFFASAFVNTTILVQIFSVLALVSALALLREGARFLGEAMHVKAAPVSA